MTVEPRIARIRRPSEEAQSGGTAVAATSPVAQPAVKATPRDLRRARRKAKRLGLTFSDDHEALSMLTARGIDVAAEESMLELVPETKKPQATLSPAPIIAPPPPAAPSAPAPSNGEAERLAEIADIQRQLVRRRRGRLALLALKLAFFVILPTVIVGWYYHYVATEMYETKSAFVIQQAESAGNPMGGLLAGTGFANSKDSVAVQEYLTSREALQRLDDEYGFVTHFQDQTIDEIQRLPDAASDEEAYRLYKKNVRVGFDPTEGIIRMDVIAAEPRASEIFSKALIQYAEDRVDHQTARIRIDQMAGATTAYEDAQNAVEGAQDRVLELQQRRGILSAEVEISAQMSLINALELEREQKRLDLAQVRANSRPNDTRIAVMNAELEQIDARIAELRAALTKSSDTNTSLALITGELAVAEADLANRQLMLQSALQQVEAARVEANRQVRYLSTAVEPIASDVATYPRKLENTILAFVIFAGLYILVSLTVSILREQVSV